MSAPFLAYPQRRRTGTVSGYLYRAAVTDARGAEAKSAPRGDVRLCRPRAGLLIPSIGPRLHTYFSLPWTLSVLTGWAETLTVGAAGAVGP